MGALNLYSTQIDAFDEHDVALAPFSRPCRSRLVHLKGVEDLKAGLASRQLIGQATGLLMARQQISETDAFTILSRASQRLNIKLRKVADRIVHPGPG